MTKTLVSVCFNEVKLYKLAIQLWSSGQGTGHYFYTSPTYEIEAQREQEDFQVSQYMKI